VSELVSSGATSEKMKHLTGRDHFLFYKLTSESRDTALFMLPLQDVPIKNNPLEKILYFSHDSTDFSQTFRLCM